MLNSFTLLALVVYINIANSSDNVLLRFRVCESEFVDLTPNKPEKVGDVPGAATAVVPAGSKKVPYTIHVSFLNNDSLRLSDCVTA